MLSPLPAALQLLRARFPLELHTRVLTADGASMNLLRLYGVAVLHGNGVAGRSPEPHLAVHWGYLLQRAYQGGDADELAYRLLLALQPVVAAYNTPLELQLRWMRRHPGRHAVPFVSTASFDSHLRELIQQKPVRRAVTRSMEATLPAALVVRAHSHAAACPKVLHQSGGGCPTCLVRSTFRGSVSVFNGPTLLNPQLWRNLQLRPMLGRGEAPVTKSLWHTAARYLAEALPCDGVVPLPYQGTVVDWRQVSRTLHGYARAGLLTVPEFGEVHEMSQEPEAYLVRRAFGEWRQSPQVGRRPRPLEELVTQAGFPPEPPDAFPACEVYNTQSLLHCAAMSPIHLKRMEEVREARRTAGKKPTSLKSAPPTLEYLGQPLYVSRRRVQGERRNLFTLPYTVSAETLASLRLPGRHQWRWGGLSFYTPYAVKRIAEALDTDEARLHLEWVHHQNVVLTDEAYRRMALEGARARRGDTGGQGLFTQAEDDVLRSFFISRPARTRVTAQEWETLLTRLPGRSKDGILRRLEVLGKAFAKEVGWRAYVDSGLCLNLSAKRRARWLEDGVRL